MSNNKEMSVFTIPFCDFCLVMGKQLEAAWHGKTRNDLATLGKPANMCQEHMVEKGRGNMSKLIKMGTTLILLFFVYTSVSFAEFHNGKNVESDTPETIPMIIEWAKTDKIPHEKAIAAIIGEAEGETFQGKIAVACAIRNRGNLKGVYGIRAPRVLNHKYSDKTYDDASKAWKISEDDEACEFINGASFWEGDAFKRPSWSKNMTLTAHVGHQKFYKQ